MYFKNVSLFLLPSAACLIIIQIFVFSPIALDILISVLNWLIWDVGQISLDLLYIKIH